GIGRDRRLRRIHCHDPTHAASPFPTCVWMPTKAEPASPLPMENGKGAALVLLGATCGHYAILADIRNCPGVTPTRRLKWWENWLWSEKPACAATSARDRSPPPCRSSLARSTRRAMTYWWGGSPVARLNCRAKW